MAKLFLGVALGCALALAASAGLGRALGNSDVRIRDCVSAYGLVTCGKYRFKQADIAVIDGAPTGRLACQWREYVDYLKVMDLGQVPGSINCWQPVGSVLDEAPAANARRRSSQKIFDWKCLAESPRLGAFLSNFPALRFYSVHYFSHNFIHFHIGKRLFK